MNAKISVFVIFVEVIIYLLLHSLYDCTFNTSLPVLESLLKDVAQIPWDASRWGL